MLTDVLYQEEGEFKVYGQENVLSGDFEKGIRWIAGKQFEALSNYHANSGDLLFTRKGSIGGCCSFPIGARPGIIDSDTIRVSLNQEVISQAFLLLAFKFSQYQEVQIQMLKRGAILSGLNTEVLANLVILTPSLPEQTQIAAFLDRETAKIDELVAEQRRLMERLKEKRQAVISHAVTQGLNPKAPMKPSGIEWLGSVPEHWEVKPLKYSITKIEQGWSPQCASEPAAENEWGVLKVGCGNRDRFDPNEQKALPLDVEPQPQYEIKAGDILMSRGNTLELVGSATFVEQVRPRLLLCDLLYRFRAKPDRAESEFLVLSLRSPNVRFQIERDATGTSSSMKKIGQGIIREFVIALPPRDEQFAIIKFIKIETAKLDTLTAEAQCAIDLLQERRTA
ncbi:MAG: hypothetical protein CFE26_07920, partial [Verrucomicrobiales bacterium VVV1]